MTTSALSSALALSVPAEPFFARAAFAAPAAGGSSNDISRSRRKVARDKSRS
ncbi:hypothetical protein [Nitrososphaera sp.]|uniref:hypothetical protein n=1 Tax=Nitrososphaera sp. TaxID=1971748 RepID=UPI00307DCD39